MRWTQRVVTAMLIAAFFAGLIQLVVFLSQWLPHSAYIEPELVEHLVTNGTLQVLVRFNLEVASEDVLDPQRWSRHRNRASYMQSQILDALRDIPNVEVRAEYEYSPVIALEIPPEALERLQHHPFVNAILENKVLTLE